MEIRKFDNFLVESKKERKYNNLLKNLKVMDNKGNINLIDMMDKIQDFLSKGDNREKFLKDFDNHLKDKIDISKKEIKVKNLKPSQSEIFLDHVLSRLVDKDDEREDILDGKLKDEDILISSDGHIIDGHHRWAHAYMLNPECELHCTEIQIPIEYALPIINAMIESDDDKSDDELKEYKINIYKVIDWNKDKLIDLMDSMISDNLNKKSKSFYKHIKKKLNLEKHPLKKMRKNLKEMEKPLDLFGDREDMPQLNKKKAKDLL